MDKRTSYAEIWLSYYKQGDDFGQHAETAETLAEAFEDHSEQMANVSVKLHEISEIVSKYPEEEITAAGDGRLISIEGPEELITELIEANLAEVPEWDTDYKRYSVTSATIEEDIS